MKGKLLAGFALISIASTSGFAMEVPLFIMEPQQSIPMKFIQVFAR